MDRRTDRSFAFDLIDAELRDYTQLRRLVISHTIAPVRAACGLPAPSAGEDVATVLGDPRALDFVQDSAKTGWGVPPDRPDLFDPVCRAMLLFAWLFPAAVPDGALERLLGQPGQAVLTGADWLLRRGYDEVADLTAGLAGVPTDAQLGAARRSAGPWPEPDWFFDAPDVAGPYKDLRTARAMLGEALDPRGSIRIVVDIEPIEIGLEHVGFLVAQMLDREMREHVRQRLVWFGHLEMVMEPMAGGGWRSTGAITGRTRGVLSTQIPESIGGLAFLDFAEQLGAKDGKAGRCAACGALFVLNAWQRRRAAKGEPVYHRGCYAEHRAAAIREHHRRAYTPRPRGRREA
jgi:hypothetical protein